MTPCAPANNPRQRQRERSAVRRLARVRQAVPSDAAALVELVAAVTAEPGGWYGEPGRWTAAGAAELIESACRDGGKAILVAEVDGQLVAQLCMEVDRHPGSSHVADVSVMVAAARRRCGIATALMAAAESVAAASQLAKIELHVRPRTRRRSRSTRSSDTAARASVARTISCVAGRLLISSSWRRCSVSDPRSVERAHGPECVCVRCRGFEPGNEFARLGGQARATHGAYAELDPRATAIAETLAAIAPAYREADEPLIRLTAGVLARIEAAHQWLAEQPIGIFKDAAGELQPVLRALSTWENTAGRFLGMLGCSPVTRAQLGVDIAVARRTQTLTEMHAGAKLEQLEERDEGES